MTARTGLADLITELRGYAEAGTAEYSIVGSGGTVNYWDDVQLQGVLDAHRTDVTFEQLKPFPVHNTGGSLDYFEYRTQGGWLEQTTGGSAVFYIQDSTGTLRGTATYSADYTRGVVTFTTTQAGTVLYYTGRHYDLYAAAADVWKRKAAHYAATSFDFSTDNHSISRSQVYQHCLEMAAHFEGKSGDAIQAVSLFRRDTD